jgi:ABC-type sugar transport system ATPase subunit
MLYVTHDQVEAMTLADRVVVLDRGRLQQAGPPGEVYDRPANAFVAGFIGNPPMNLFPARFAPDGALHLGVRALAIPRRFPPGAPRTAGVRPEAIGLGGRGEGAVPATVEHVECLGHETLAHVRVEDDAVALVARVEGMPRFSRGDAVGLRIDPARVHLFGEDGRALDGPEAR